MTFRRVALLLLAFLGCAFAIRPFFNFTEYREFASIIGPTDNRFPFGIYAERAGLDLSYVFNRYKATGTFWCGSHQSATVVDKDLIVLAAHAFYDLDENGQCKPITDFNKCYFEVLSLNGEPGRRVYIDPKSLTVSPAYNCVAEDFNVDWAVVRLNDELTEIQPYSVIDLSGLKLNGAEILQVATYADNLYSLGKNIPTICKGTLGFIWNMPIANSTQKSMGLGTSCSSGRGSSGGSILIDQPGKNPILVGIISMGKNLTFDFKPFSRSNFTGGPQLSSEFYAAVMNAISAPKERSADSSTN